VIIMLWVARSRCAARSLLPAPSAGARRAAANGLRHGVKRAGSSAAIGV
jgi:hypothetical protein